MMTTNLGACEKFVVDLRKSGLIDRGNLDQVLDEFLKDQPRAEPAVLADFLIQNGYLTPFQANRISSGKAQDMVLGPYVLMDIIGSGSMGTVFKAQSKSDKEWYAVKVLPRRSMWNVLVAKRIVRNYESIRHVAVVPFIDVGTAGGTHYLVWPFAEGEALDKIVARDGRLPPAATAHLGQHIAEGLSVAHQRNLFHGMVKPSNIMISPDNEVHVLDFGVGSLLVAAEGESLIDTQSMANAQASGLDCVSPESILDPTNLTPDGDQYSLGCVLYFCLCGQYPFPGDSAVEKMQAHQAQQPTPIRELAPEVPPEMVAVLTRMMQKKPSDRYSSMIEVIDVLGKLVKTAPTSVSDGPPPGAAKAQARSVPTRQSLREPAAPPPPAPPPAPPRPAPKAERPKTVARPAAPPPIPAAKKKPTGEMSQEDVSRAMGPDYSPPNNSAPPAPKTPAAVRQGAPAPKPKAPSGVLRASQAAPQAPQAQRPSALPSRALRRPFESSGLMPLYKSALRLPLNLSIIEKARLLLPPKYASERVDCTVMAPPVLPQSASAAVHVLVFDPAQLLAARNLATLCRQNINLVNAASLAMNVPTGTQLRFHLTVPDLQLDHELQLMWQGYPDIVVFPFKVPQGTQPGEAKGKLTVYRGPNLGGAIEFSLRIVTGNEKSPVPEPIPIGAALANG
jgi:serine/threonine-protein kinase